MKEGFQSSVCSSFTEIPGLTNVGSPVNLKKNQNKCRKWMILWFKASKFCIHSLLRVWRREVMLCGEELLR